MADSQSTLSGISSQSGASLTRKHFKLIAEAVASLRTFHAHDVALSEHVARAVRLSDVADRLATALARTNPRFDRARFLAACLGQGTCGCADPGCPAHAGKGTCRHDANTTVYRCDMDDKTGTRMCADCAADALNSGVFYAL